MADAEGEPERRIVVGVDGSVPSKAALAWDGASGTESAEDGPGALGLAARKAPRRQ